VIGISPLPSQQLPCLPPSSSACSLYPFIIIGIRFFIGIGNHQHWQSISTDHQLPSGLATSSIHHPVIGITNIGNQSVMISGYCQEQHLPPSSHRQSFYWLDITPP